MASRGKNSVHVAQALKPGSQEAAGSTTMLDDLSFELTPTQPKL